MSYHVKTTLCHDITTYDIGNPNMHIHCNYVYVCLCGRCKTDEWYCVFAGMHVAEVGNGTDSLL